jgi:hypothetical protein
MKHVVMIAMGLTMGACSGAAFTSGQVEERDAAGDADHRDTGAPESAASDGGTEACAAPASFTCAADKPVQVNTPGEFCVRWPWMGGMTAAARTTPAECQACGAFTCACVLRAQPNPCSTTGFTCSNTINGPFIECQ